MLKQLPILLLIAVAGGGVYFLMNYEVQRQSVDGKPAYWKIVPKGTAVSSDAPAAPSATPLRSTIRIAAFQFGRLDDAKLANHQVSDVLMRLLPSFDCRRGRAWQKPRSADTADRAVERRQWSKLRLRHVSHAATRCVGALQCISV
jgi:hypothetical protein